MVRAVVLVVFAAACGDDGPSKQPVPPPPTSSPAKQASEAKEPAPEPAPEPEPSPVAIAIGHVDTTDALMLEHMYWMPSQYMLGRKPTLAFTGTVRALAKMKPRRPNLQGGPRFVFEARLEVEEVLHGSLDRGFVVVELADKLEVGDRLVVFGHEHEAKLGLIEAKGSNCRVGIEVSEWTDPIVAALRATLAGTADLADPATADAWRPYGEAAIECVLDRRAVATCD